MNDITGLLNNVETEYKDSFTRANSDYYSLSKPVLVGDEIIFEFILNSNPNANSYLMGVGATIFRMFIPSSGILADTNWNVTDIKVDDVSIPLGDDLYTHTGKNIKVFATSQRDDTILFIGAFEASNLTFQGEFLSFTIDGETFTPTGNGLTYEGREGTIVTRNTSHSGALDYINHELIQPI